VFGIGRAKRVSSSLRNLYRLPVRTPERENESGTRVNSSPAFTCRPQLASRRSTYLKLVDRASVLSCNRVVAAAFMIENGRIVEARLAAGVSAPLPWRPTG